MNRASTNRHYYPALDGLRGLAILLVLFVHNFGFINYFFFGWLGVDLFFVLSGFLITDVLLNSLDSPHFLRNFYVRRVLRIFPLFYLLLIICLLILPSIRSLPLQANYYTENQFWLWTYLQNWLFVFREPYGDQVLLHTWSLAVEEQFYLVWPLIILLVRKPRLLLVLVLLLLLVIVIARYIVWTYKIEDLSYASLYTFTRIDGLCIGAALALLLRVKPEFLKKNTFFIVLLMSAVNFAFYFINDRRGFTLPYLAFVGYTTFAVLFGILVYEAVTRGSKLIEWLFNNRFMKFFGRISYGLYVFHWPINILLYEHIKRYAVEKNFGLRGAEIVSAICVSGIAIALSVLSYYYFERPFLKLKERFTPVKPERAA
jgi:peptidoglycan/LPS O-acetylase OafA/YrhL